MADETAGNRHPADELASVRLQIRELKEQEDALRQQLIEMPRRERAGVKYVALVIERDRRQIDIDKLEDELGDIERFYRKTNFVLVKVEKLK